ncbi:MAG: Tll0287-like domain-containing protein [Nitritalea sp.]
MRRILLVGYTLLFGWTWSACSTNERVDREVFEQVNRSMEAKKLSEATILKGALEWGEELADEAQAQLINALREAIEREGVVGAIDFCQVNAISLIEEVGPKGIEIRRVSHDYRNPADAPREEEEPFLDMYAYNVENGLKSEPNVQKIEGGEVLLFTRAITIPGEFCLACHGKEGSEIAAETLAKLTELYPEDKARNHAVGDLRGMWSIRLPKREVVKKL